MTGERPVHRRAGEKIVELPGGRARTNGLHMQTADPLRTPTYTLFPKPDYYFSTSGAERQHQQRVRVQPRLLQPEHRRHLGGARRPGCRGARGRRPAAGHRATKPHDPNSTQHGAAGEHCRHLGRGDRPAADAVAPGRADRRLPDRRSRDHPGASSSVAGARGDGQARGRVRADQFQRRGVRDRHADRGHARAGLQKHNDHAYVPSRRSCRAWRETATGTRRRSRRR